MDRKVGRGKNTFTGVDLEDRERETARSGEWLSKVSYSNYFIFIRVFNSDIKYWRKI